MHDGWQRYVDSTGRIWRALPGSIEHGAMVVMSEHVTTLTASYNNRNTQIMTPFWEGTGNFAGHNQRLAPELIANARPFTHVDARNNTISAPGFGTATATPLFVVSEAELTRWGLSTAASRIAFDVTGVAREWITRTPGTGTLDAQTRTVTTTGAQGHRGLTSAQRHRPAMWVNLATPNRDTWTAGPGLSTQTVQVTAPPVSWAITSNQPWLTVSAASGTGNASFTMTAQANPFTFARMAVVTVGGRHIRVTQQASGGGMGFGPAGMPPVTFDTPGWRQEWENDNWRRFIDSTGLIWRELPLSLQNGAVVIMTENVIGTATSFENRHASIFWPMWNGTGVHPIAHELRANARAFIHADTRSETVSVPNDLLLQTNPLFLLSNAELTVWGFGSNADRVAVDAGGVAREWVLRSPNNGVSTAGAITTNVLDTTARHFRPALWVNATPQ